MKFTNKTSPASGILRLHAVHQCIMKQVYRVGIITESVQPLNVLDRWTRADVTQLYVISSLGPGSPEQLYLVIISSFKEMRVLLNRLNVCGM